MNRRLKISMLLTSIMEFIVVVMLLIGKFNFYQFVISITLLDILYRLEVRELKESEG